MSKLNYILPLAAFVLSYLFFERIMGEDVVFSFVMACMNCATTGIVLKCYDARNFVRRIKPDIEAIFKVQQETIERLEADNLAAWQNRDRFCASINRIARMIGMKVENAAEDAVERNLAYLLDTMRKKARRIEIGFSNDTFFIDFETDEQAEKFADNGHMACGVEKWSHPAPTRQGSRVSFDVPGGFCRRIVLQS